MKQSIFHSSLVLLCLTATPGCTPLSRQDTSPVTVHRAPLTAYMVAQLGFGNVARFGLCIPPACPVVTPKHAMQEEKIGPQRTGVTVRDDGRTSSLSRHPVAPVNVLTVYFTTGQATLDREARRSIDALVTSMPVQRVRIAARTDSTGNPAQNARLVHRRAVAVADYLKAMPLLAGVPIDTEAKALCCYVATNADPNGRRLNRRVDIALVPEDPEGAP